MNSGMPQDPYQQSIFPQFSPQAALVSSLTRMDKDKRKDFLDQLSEASPEALHALSGMMTAPQQQQQYGSPGMYGGMPMNPYGMPPWMMQQPQQPQQQQSQADPMEMAMNMVATIFELTNKAKPPADDTMKDMLREFKDEMKSMRERIDTSRNSSPIDSAILEKMNSLQNQINQSHQPKTVADSITEISTLMEGFKKIGLIKEPVVAGETVDDKIKLKELEHKIKVEDKQQELAEKKLSADEQKLQFGQRIFATELQKSLFKNKTPDDPDKKPGNVNPNVKSSFVTEKPSNSNTFISEISTEGGTVRETRPTVKSLSNVVV